MVDTPGPLCHYATQPGRRPDCQITAVLRRGGLFLCTNCDAQRSTLGKGQPATTIRPTPTPADPLDWVTQAQDRLTAAQEELDAAVTRARRHGHTWAAIADRIGVTRQAVQQRYGPQ